MIWELQKKQIEFLTQNLFELKTTITPHAVKTLPGKIKNLGKDAKTQNTKYVEANMRVGIEAFFHGKDTNHCDCIRKAQGIDLYYAMLFYIFLKHS